MGGIILTDVGIIESNVRFKIGREIMIYGFLQSRSMLRVFTKSV